MELGYVWDVPICIIFGSDWPGAGDIDSVVEKVDGLPLESSTIEAILWGNGARLLGLDGTA